MDDALYADLLAEIRRIPMVDTHDHLEEEGDTARLARDGLAILTHYVACDMAACGQDRAWKPDPRLEVRAQFDAIQPHWDRARHGAYMRTLERGLEALHGVERLTRENCERVFSGMVARYPRGEYRRALKELANIEVSLIDPLDPEPGGSCTKVHRGLDCDPEYFLCDYHERATGDFAAQARALTRRTGIEIGDVGSWMRALEADIAAAAPYAPGIKCAIGYERVLDFAPVDARAAEPVAARALAGEPLNHRDYCLLTDHLVDRIAGFAADHDLALKLHTGLAYNGDNWIERCDPVPLTPFIRRHPRTRIDLFHISYPYYREAALLAKYYHNVTVDLCWAWAFSPVETAAALDVLIDLVPTGKVFAFGGDYYHLEGVVGHAIVAREGIARVLAERVRRRHTRPEDAIDIARVILRDGPLEHFGIVKKRARVRADRAARAAHGSAGA